MAGAGGCAGGDGELRGAAAVQGGEEGGEAVGVGRERLNWVWGKWVFVEEWELEIVMIVGGSAGGGGGGGKREEEIENGKERE